MWIWQQASGYIRKATLSSESIPFEERVDKALRKILQLKKWSKSKKIGLPSLPSNFDGQIIRVLADFQDAIWEEAS